MSARAFTVDEDAAGPRRTASISQGFEELLASEAPKTGLDDNAPFDVVIVGSGYGGAIAAAELAGCTKNGDDISVCVLERGSEYLPGMFPSRLGELPRHVRFSTGDSAQPQGRRTGLFDVRAGGDVNALVANGLGGGSLINAGVMATPDPELFDTRWSGPDDLKDKVTRQHWYDEAKTLLGANAAYDGDRFAKFKVLKTLSKGGTHGIRFEPAPLSTLMPALNVDPKNAPFGTCNGCGDCATGCNSGAKNSLDTNLLARAYSHGAKIYTGATVLRILPCARGKPWCLEVVHTDAKLRARHGAPSKLYAHKVILAAGTFGSTEILLRSNDPGLAFSPRLGQQFSANGDTIAALYNHDPPEANAVANEACAVRDRGVGPTITGMLSARGEKDRPIVIEELAIPGALRRLFEEVISTANILHTLDKPDDDTHSKTDADPCAVDRGAIGRTSIFALMGDDDAKGAIELICRDAQADGDGAVRVRWPEVSDHPLFEDQLRVLGELAKDSGVLGEGKLLPNPLWRFVPKDLEEFFGSARGPAFTVHPLGGCVIGKDWQKGVVDEFGRVFMADPEPGRSGADVVWPGLVVLDGSIVPAALGTNPALTIAVLALRAIRHLREKVWHLDLPTRAPRSVPPRLPPSPQERVPQTESRFELVERLVGFAKLELDGGRSERCAIELTLKFQPFPLTRITGRHKERLELKEKLEPKEAPSQLRIFREEDWRRWRRSGQPETELAKLTHVTMSLTGSLTALQRADSKARTRRCRALRAWLCNRGLRDSWQWLWQPGPSVRPGPDPGARRPVFFDWIARAVKRVRKFGGDVWTKYVNANALASRAGEVRLLEYELTIGKRIEPGLRIVGLEAGASFKGVKRLTYERRANPWRQLQELELQGFPGDHQSERIVLKLDLRYLSDETVPLVRIVEQQDQVAALTDVVSFLAYVLRLMIMVHVWSFRRPETPKPREPQRLPGVLRRGWWRRPKPIITELEVDERDGTPVRVRLTHYRPWWRPKGRPIVMIHGYSASGTTFAHHAVRPNLATYFLARRRDVWILDLRTSSGMPTARLPWAFEEAALVDIPAALAHIKETTDGKIDVIAHCMGSAMFSMAVLAKPRAGDKFWRERDQLPSWINRAVLSQVGPLVEFSAANVFRGYVLSYIRQFLPLQRYEFRTSPDPSLTDQLIDRVLATLPYPAKEFDLENPPWAFWRKTPWVGTRHRMDALYARDFNLTRIPRRVLRYIDDLFGPLSIDTVSQGIHFARHNVITNRAGRNVYVSRHQLKERWKFPTLSVHGEDNGLADVATLGHMKRAFSAAGIPLEIEPFKGFGHQDSLIGRGARKVFRRMAHFLSDKHTVPQDAGHESEPRVAVPWLGPHVGPLEHPRGGEKPYLPVRAATQPGALRAEFAVILAVREENGHFVLPSVGGKPDWRKARLPAMALDEHGWIRVNLDDPEPWSENAAGLLMLLLDEPGRVEARIPDYRTLRARLRERRRLLTLAAESAEEFLPAHMHDGLSGDAREAIADYLERIRAAVLRELANKPSTDLQCALIEIPKPADELCFAFGSCHYPAGLLDAEVADQSMEMLSERLAKADQPKPNFLVLLGDQVYVDATAGLFDPTSSDDRYARPYERLYERKAVQSVLRRLPSYMLLDDHEIDDDWEPSREDLSAERRRLNTARRSYWRYQRFDDFDDPAREFEVGLSRSFEEAGCPFYLADTRTRRMPRTAMTIPDARIMDDSEFGGLLTWLLEWHNRAPERPKFIASPALPLPRHLRTRDGSWAGALRSDGWDGYPRSLRALLGWIAVHEITNVVFLSGDEHLSCVATATLRADGCKAVDAYSIHSSALYAPFPFANADPADFADTETFTFHPEPDDFPFPPGDIHNAFVGRSCSCKVVTEFAPPGDGFTILRFDLKDPSLYCEFVRRGRDGGEPPRKLRLSPKPGG